MNAEKRSYEELDQFGLYVSGNKVTDQPQDPVPETRCQRGYGKKRAVIQAKQKAAMAAAKEEEEKAEEAVVDVEPKEEITFEDFGKMQFQVGEIISCEKKPVKEIEKTPLASRSKSEARQDRSSPESKHITNRKIPSE